MTVKLVRMWSGEDVIADIVEESSDSIVITDPIVAVPSPQQGNIAFAPWSPLHKKGKIKVSEKYVVYIGEPQEEIIEDYKTMFGKISTPTKKYVVYIGEPQKEIIEQYKSMFGKISTPTKKLIL